MSVKFLLLLLVSLSLSPGKQTIARLKTNNTQVFVYIIYENTRSPRLLRADLARTADTNVRSVEGLSRSSSHRRSQRQRRRFGSFLRCLSVLSLTAFPFFHSGILQRQEAISLATTNSRVRFSVINRMVFPKKKRSWRVQVFEESAMCWDLRVVSLCICIVWSKAIDFFCCFFSPLSTQNSSFFCFDGTFGTF